MLVHPRRTSRELAQDTSLHSASVVVLSFGLITALLFLVSHLRHDYPPPASQLDVWIETWGEFAMLPFLKIPAETYRLTLALVMLPLSVSIWILMAGTAWLFARLAGGSLSFDQYLNIFGHSFFVFWIIGQFLDLAYSVLLSPWELPALRGEYGPGAYTCFAAFPSVQWFVMLTLGAIYNGIAAHELERYSSCKAVLVAGATFIWPIVLISALLR
jgi:hypothetical protein